VSQVLQILGALAVLGAFIAVQAGWLMPRSYPSLILNLAGSGLLAVLALIGGQWGFLLLEASWAAVSAAGLWSQHDGPWSGY
jgi:hypothetical protein